MKIRIRMKAEAKTGNDPLNFVALFSKAKAEVAQATRTRDNAQAALDMAQSKLNDMVEQRLKSYAA